MGAAIAALVGAGVWAFVSWKMDVEIGYIAWGIGGLVGYAGARLGSSGGVGALACGALALLSIAAGKGLALEFAIEAEVNKTLDEMITQEKYDEAIADARAFVQITDESEYAKFMVEHNYVDGKDASSVSEEELANFETQVPDLRRWSDESPSYETWSTERRAEFGPIISEFYPRVEIFKESLSGFDLLWLFLGVGTAFQLGKGGHREE